MAWILPTVMATCALAGAAFVHAQSTDSSSSTESLAAEPATAKQPTWQLADAENAEQPTATVSTQSEPATAAGEDAATASAENLTTESEVKTDPTEVKEEFEEQADADADGDADEMAAAGDEPDAEEDLTEEQRAAQSLALAQRRYNLDQQFEKLQETLQFADAYSLELAEDYYSYGLLLRDNAQYEDAVDALTKSMHIQKANHGIYAAEQRPALKALFETHYALGNVEEFEEYLERILWIESKNPEINDTFSYEMLLQVGNEYIDVYLKDPRGSQQALQTLLRAKHHLNRAFKRGKDRTLQLSLMPYGELALVYFLESRLMDSTRQATSIDENFARGPRPSDAGKEAATAAYLASAFPRGKGLLANYLKRATDAQDNEHIVRALVALGDFDQLFKKYRSAEKYYKAAWDRAQKLDADSAVRGLFTEPTPLPAFEYAYEREPVVPDKPTVMVPLLVDIDQHGDVENIRKGAESELIEHHFSRARRAARRLVFRPLVVDGELTGVKDYVLEQRVRKRKS